MAVRVDRQPDPAAFWRATQAFLELDEAGNTQLLAVASRHAGEPGATPPCGFIVTEDGTVRAAAMLAVKGTLFLTPTVPALLRLLRQSIADAGREATDIIAERVTAAHYAQLTNMPFRLQVGLRLYRLDAVAELPPVPGTMRPATDADFDLLCAWQRAFFVDANVHGGTEEVTDLVRRRVQTGGGWIREVDGTPVAHAGHRQTPVRSARIAPVYTPPEHRGRGYASALVAALSRHLLAQGHAPIYLFADTGNPTANGVYLRVGFRAVGEHVHLTRAEPAG